MSAIIALAAAVTVPAIAEPGQWQAFTPFPFGEERVELTPMPFEKAGENFPGSAFFYLDDTPGLAYEVEELKEPTGSGEAIQFAASHDPDASARAFRSAGSGLDKARALQCLSMAVYYEAASESHSGQRAVAQVVLNRVAHPSYPASICGVVFQGSERSTGCQFTFTCDGSLYRKPSRAGWARAQEVALSALAGEVFAPVGTATHYHTNYVNPYWAASLDHIGTIGAHRFYRWKGRAGATNAFTVAYHGGEPLAAPKARTFTDASTPAPPTVPPPPAPAFTSNHAKVPPVGTPAESAPLTSDNLPGGGEVKPEYARSGRWIRQPN